MKDQRRTEFDKIRDALTCLDEAEKLIVQRDQEGWQSKFFQNFSDARLMMHSFLAKVEADHKRLVVAASRPRIVSPDGSPIQ